MFKNIVLRIARRRHTKNLQKLQEILENLPPERIFNMQVWGNHDASHMPSVEEGFCGTAACALGHGAMHPYFNKRGLSLYWARENATDPRSNWSAGLLYHGERDRDVEIIGQDLFGLSTSETRALFFSWGATRENIIKQIESLISFRKELENV